MRGRRLGPEAYRAIYDYSADGVLFTAPDGRVLAANPAACAMLRRSEEEICALGRQGMVDPGDERWGLLVAQRASTGRIRGTARMQRGDLTLIEVEITSQVFCDDDGQERTCTILRDVTDRVAMERDLNEMSAQLRHLALTDELTGLRNRRGFLTVAQQMLEVADRQLQLAQLLFIDVDNMKDLNDYFGHGAGDVALQAVAGALTEIVRHSDVVARIGGDEFVALVIGLDDTERDNIVRRVDACLRAADAVTAVGRPVEISVGWATRQPFGPASAEDLLIEADRSMYRDKVRKSWQRPSNGAGPGRFA